MDNEFEVIKEFNCHGKTMVIVRNSNAAHVMSLDEWSKVYGRNHQEKWATKVNWNRFTSRKKYNKKNAS